jgi:hypothetical protein
LYDRYRWVNPEAMAEYKLKGGSKKGGIIANPNCSTIIALMAVTPLHRAAGLALFTHVILQSKYVQRGESDWVSGLKEVHRLFFRLMRQPFVALKTPRRAQTSQRGGR